MWQWIWEWRFSLSTQSFIPHLIYRSLHQIVSRRDVKWTLGDLCSFFLFFYYPIAYCTAHIIITSPWGWSTLILRSWVGYKKIKVKEIFINGFKGRNANFFFINESGIFLNRIKGWNLGGNRSILKPIKWLVKSIIFTNGDIFKKKSQKEQKKRINWIYWWA